MKGFVYLILFFAVTVFITYVVLLIYSPNKSLVEPMAVFYEPYKAKAELEAHTEAGANAGMLAYLAFALLDPLAVADDLAKGGEGLKKTVKQGVLLSHELFSLTYSPTGINASCFCAPYDEKEFREALKESSEKGLMYLPKGSKSLGVSCEDAIEVYLLNVSDSFSLAEVFLAKDGYRFACIAQSSSFSNLALIRPKISSNTTVDFNYDLSINISEII